MDNHILITFKNTIEAMKAEENLKIQAIKVTVIPTPTNIIKSYGVSIKTNKNELKKIKSLIENNKINTLGIYEIVNGKFKEI